MKTVIETTEYVDKDEMELAETLGYGCVEKGQVNYLDKLWIKETFCGGDGYGNCKKCPVYGNHRCYTHIHYLCDIIHNNGWDKDELVASLEVKDTYCKQMSDCYACPHIDDCPLCMGCKEAVGKNVTVKIIGDDSQNNIVEYQFKICKVCTKFIIYDIKAALPYSHTAQLDDNGISIDWPKPNASDFSKSVWSGYNSANWNRFRLFILDRDQHICIFCGTLANIVHHMSPIKYAADLAFDPKNCCTVCNKCLQKLRYTEHDPDAQEYEDVFGDPETIKKIKQLHGKSVVYFIRVLDYIKIGISTNLIGRLSAIQSDVPFTKLEIVGYTEGDRKLESEIHNKFGHLRKIGEWFLATGELLDYIRENAVAL